MTSFITWTIFVRFFFWSSPSICHIVILTLIIRRLVIWFVPDARAGSEFVDT